MAKMMSYSKIEKTILHNFRNKINHAESTEDLKKFFTYSAQELLNNVFVGKITFAYDDISFLPDNEPHYHFSEGLFLSDDFRAVWESSDLQPVMERLAKVAVNHYIRLGKNPAKTEAKIRM